MALNAEGFVLAGGRSSRFGSDKALALLGGRPLIAHAVGTLRKLRIPVRVVTRDPHLYARWAAAFVTREQPDRGPVEGLRASLESAEAPWVFVLSVDMPLVGPRQLERLWEEARTAPKPPHPALVFRHDGRLHPFPGLYSRGHLDAIRILPVGSSMHALLEQLPTRSVDFGGDPQDLARALRNVNTPEELAALGGGTGRK